MDRRVFLGFAGSLLAAPSVLRAQGLGAGFPDRPLRLIVPWAPGGSTDTIARLFQPRLAEVLGRAVVIDNRGGASGATGAMEAARAPADGSTWTFVYDTQATNETVMRLPFRTMEAFVPVCHAASGPLAMVAHHTSPYHSFQQVVDAAKQAPDTLNYATSGVGGLAHVATTLLQQQGGFRLVHVPYRGGGPAVQDVVAGHVPLFMTNVVIVSQHIRAGTLRALGVTTATESRHVPGCPTFASQGFGSFAAPTWWALLGRAGTPAPLVRQMNEAMVQVLNEPAVKSKIEEQGCDIVASTPQECGRFIEAEIAKWARVITDNNIRVDS
ncbi:tripartite tricarboxylate transporter substrate binding protein [Roseococcus sp. SYP-B2431]|uniref:tripartite tricarboxylate transporter substrate binding protein n=1 Tax=Roseococcus sp. SYP-B2431 TaxID=2496640 RepID=UPI0010402F9E|nr:tripartite tricarboxylate transporter substrate binding protein [Roseococcus sp. SYP-B2431]TCH96933.1 tripartite tricarboxylate transporter substrate binding protein [Roseococcus sp. SYP-B2431]